MGKKEESSVSTKMNRKSTRCKLKFSNDDKAQTPRQGSARGTAMSKELPISSVYEISFRSSISYDSDSEATQVCLADVAPLAIERQKQSDDALKIFENTLIGSHYPRFPDTESESDNKSVKKVDLKIQTSLSSYFTRGSKLLAEKQPTDESAFFQENEKKVMDELQFVSSDFTLSTSDSEKPPPVKPDLHHEQCREGETEKEKSQNMKVNRKVRKKMIKSFFPQNDPEKELVHLHHHEHHHHYHFDQKPIEDGDLALPTKISTTANDLFEVTAAKKSQLGKYRVPEEEKSKHTYYYVCCPEEGDEVSRTARTYSIESLSNQKSDLLKTHNYSDSELTRGTSDDCDSFARNSGANFASVMNSFKSLKPLSPKPQARSFQGASGSEGTRSNGTTVAEKQVSNSALPLTKVQSEEAFDRRANSGTQPPTSKKINGERKETAEGFLLREWAEKIKTELQEMKKELRVIEKEFFNNNNNNNSLCVEASHHKLKVEDESDPAISIFSSRTFILQAENFYIIEETDSESFGESTRELRD